METAIVAALLQQIFSIAGAALASGVITSLLTQALKWDAIAIPAKKYPQQVAAVLSLAVSACAVYVLNAVPLKTIGAYVVFALATLLAATQSYDAAKKAIQNVRKNS